MSGSPPLVVCFQDKSVVIIDKPAGLHTAPLRPHETDNLLARVIEVYPEVAALPGLKTVEPGLVHRLDRDTSGLVVVARTAEAFAALRAAFTEETVVKRYRACCARGEAARLPVSLETRFAPYGRGRSMVRVVLPDERSRRRLRLASGESYRTEAAWIAGTEGRALIEARITRGFRHQIRAHLSFLGLPIFGDPLYGTAVPAGCAPRMYLHAWRIEMPHPITGRSMVVESPAPPQFAALIDGAKKEGEYE
jgi:23S rRNA pseudouridine1911/1915/1917 synthase